MAGLRMMLRYDGTYLFPNSGVDHADYEKLKTGQVYSCQFKRSRNPDFHRKMFAVIKAMHVNQPEATTIENMEDYRHQLLLHLGYVHTYIIPKTGATVVRVKSMAFDEMDEDEFSELYNDLLSLAAKVYGDDFVRQFETQKAIFLM